MNSYDNWEFRNVCPWCNRLYSEVNHHAGCPEPSYPLTDRAKRLKLFGDIMFGHGRYWEEEDRKLREERRALGLKG